MGLGLLLRLRAAMMKRVPEAGQTEASMVRTWRVLGSIGPLFSDGGLKNWELLLGRDMLLARPFGIGLSLKAGVMAGIGGGLGVDLPVEPYPRPVDWDNARVIEDPGDASWRRYPVQELAFVELRRCLPANELRVQPHDRKAQVYGFGDRSLTESARALLRACYPDLYQERNFEKRWYSFIYR